MKLPNGYGNVVKLKGNRRKPYAVRVYYTDTSGAVPKRKQKYLGYFSDQKAALTFLSEYNSGHVVKEHEKYADVLTFSELYYKWQKYRQSLKTNPSASSWKNYNIAFNFYSAIHDRKITSLRHQDLQDCITAHNSKSVSTIGNMRAIVRGMWQYAIMNELLTNDITQHLVFEGVENGTPIHTRFTDAEIGALWGALGAINNVDIVLIYIYTGMRPVELLDVFSKDVHIKEKYMIGGAKTEAGRNRIVPLHDAIIPLVQYHLDKNREYLITNKYGNHYTRAVYHNTNWNTVMRRMNMLHSPHDCRYTFAALADQVSMNETCRKIIMGHSLGNKTGTAFKTGYRDDVTQGVYTEKTLEQLLMEINKLPTVFE